MHLDIKQSTLFLLFANAAAPCSEPTPPPPSVAVERYALSATPQPAGSGQPAQQTKTTASYMRGHTSDAREMRRAAIAGELEAMQRAAARIASDEWTTNLRPDYRPRVDAVRSAARGVLAAPTLADATAALGELGAACATCHRAVGGPAPTSGAAPAAAAEDGMLAHTGAEDALWQGLAYPSDESWMAGAEALSGAAALDSDVAEVSGLAHRIRSLAHGALGAGAPRPELYGKLLANCAACHTLVGVLPADDAP